ncbi:MAG: hypothetical protein FWC01_06165 [Treponema sp.]|nr:hypothetical protein [Treponema sp.]MCL2238001.1 hypothetical protein [Treponema sp.]
MAQKRLSIIRVILAAILAGFVFITAVLSLFSSNYYFIFFILSYGIITGIPVGLIISLFYLFFSLKKGKADIFCFYLLPIIVSLLICAFIFNDKTSAWDDEMYRIADIIEEHYIENGVEMLDKTTLRDLGIKENIDIVINRDRTYYIINKQKNIVYESETRTIMENYD